MALPTDRDSESTGFGGSSSVAGGEHTCTNEPEPWPKKDRKKYTGGPLPIFDGLTKHANFSGKCQSSKSKDYMDKAKGKDKGKDKGMSVCSLGFDPSSGRESCLWIYGKGKDDTDKGKGNGDRGKDDMDKGRGKDDMDSDEGDCPVFFKAGYPRTLSVRT